MKTVWIESERCAGNRRRIVIGNDWGGGTGFSKSEARRLFDAISKAVKTEFPNVTINPWSDSPHGTPDFE